MAIYVVMEPPAGGNKAEDPIFVRDSFTWLGFLVAPLWLAWNRLWIEAALTFVVMALLSVVGEKLGLEGAGSMLSLLVSLYIGFEGQNLRIAALRRRGWREWGVVQAESADDAELRYAIEAEALSPQAAAPHRIVPDAAHARHTQAGLVLGLPHPSGKS